MKKQKNTLLLFIAVSIVFVFVILSYFLITPISRIKSLGNLTNTINSIITTINVGIWKITGKLLPPILSLKRPFQLNKIGIITGEGFLQKTIFIKNTGLGRVTDIKLGNYDGIQGDELVIAGSKTVLFLDDEFNTKSKTVLTGNTRHIQLIDLEGDNRCEYLNREGFFRNVTILDHNGKAILTLNSKLNGSHINNICSGDLDNDGILDFAVGMNGGGGVSRIDKKGKMLWNMQDGNVWHIEMIDTDNDGKFEIVHSNAGGRITVRNKDGKIISKTKPEPYFSDFSPCVWPDKNGGEYLLVAEDGYIWILDFKGKTIKKLKAPGMGNSGIARGCFVKLESDKPAYFAVLIDYDIAIDRAMLNIYDSSGKLVYLEVLAESSSSIFVLSDKSSNTESLLIGSNNRVWKYNKHLLSGVVP